jgi:hypothetical protein
MAVIEKQDEACRASPAVKAKAQHEWNHPSSRVVWVRPGDTVTFRGTLWQVADEVCKPKYEKAIRPVLDQLDKRLAALRTKRRAAHLAHARERFAK